MSDTAVNHYVSELHRLQKEMGCDNLARLREAAIGRFQSQGFPSTRQENWKYTDVRPLTRMPFSLPETGMVADHEAWLNEARLPGLDCHELVFVNGRFSAELSRTDGLPEFVVLKNLAVALEEDRTLIESLIGEDNADSNPFNTLNTAFILDGVLLSVPTDCIIDIPVHLIYLSGFSDEGFAAHPRNIIALEANASVTVIENYVGADNSRYFTNTVTDAFLQENSSLTHYKLQQEGRGSYHIGNFNILQAASSRVYSHSISLGGSLVRNDIHAELKAEGAEIALQGLYMGTGKQHIDNHTRIDHLSPSTQSRENYRGVLNDQARGVFNGKVVVHKDAQKTDAAQSNANLLLSDFAEVDTKPELEIYADDVKCSHGTTVGQLDQDMLFYLRSRAIDEETARSILTYAFAEEIITQIDLQPVREYLEYRVIGRLPDADLIKEFTV